ncbi:MAG: DeoR/GlpR transcriptional regulator [Peptococcaceae bacterium]|nr:DeoR/GlpR transcriptional regulator [Peptococcaceae bacterium]
MLTEERRKGILDFVTKEGRAEVAELAEHFQVSTMTIRRDLNALNSKGLLERARGGALANESLVNEIPYKVKATSNVDIKKSIAQEAVSFVKDGDSVILDAGSTTLQIAKQLKLIKKDITVVTNDLNIALELADDPNVKVITTGGRVQPGTYSLYGEDAVTFITSVSVNIVFLGGSAIDTTSGVYTPTLEKAHLKRAMINSAAKIILAADHTKFGNRAFAKVCDFDEVDVVISDNKLDSISIQQIEKMGISLKLCKTGMS